MNSCLYRALVMHHRLEPKDFRFHYNLFMFYIDLDELDILTKKFWLISRNKFNVFNFRDKDHLQVPKENPDKAKSTREHILDYLKANGIELPNPKIMLLTNLCTFGYQFNPVSFYFIFPENSAVPFCSIAEVSNTFKEMKPFLMGNECFDGGKFHLNTTKYFYVSPFIDMDTNFDFNLGIPGNKISIRIDDFKNNQRFFISTLTGVKRKLTNTGLLWYMFRFPLITLQVITLIHWNALKLWIKKIKYYKKSENKELQKGVYKPYQE